MEETVLLRDGRTRMPRICLGTWNTFEKTQDAVRAAILAGYRMIDCANDYENEHLIGEVLGELFAEGVVTREEMFIQAKLWNANHRPEHVRQDLQATLEDLRVDYLDSYLIHWPMAVPSTGKECLLRTNGYFPAHYSKGSMIPLTDDGQYCADHESHYMETWHEMEKLVDEGQVKSIGLSNFNMRQVREVMANARKHLPSILQNESHPYLQEKDVRDFCRIHKIVFQAFSPLGSPARLSALSSGFPSTGFEVLEHPVIAQLAEKHGRTPAQVALRWHLEMGGTTACKSVTEERITRNYQVWDFALDSGDMSRMSDLNVGWRNLVVPELSVHEDYPFKDWVPYGYILQKPGQ